MALELRALSLAPKGRPPLFAPLTLSVAGGEIVTVMAPSGAGKSTLLDAIAGHLSVAFSLQGEILLDDVVINHQPPEQRRIGILFQDALLFPHLSVGDNLAFGLHAGITGRQQRRRTVANALASAGLAGLSERDPASLSGGQRSRVALLRTLLAQPRALLLDEAFASLDPVARSSMRALAITHVRERGIPALLVTHDREDALACGGRIVQLQTADDRDQPLNT